MYDSNLGQTTRHYHSALQHCEFSPTVKDDLTRAILDQLDAVTIIHDTESNVSVGEGGEKAGEL